MSRFIDEAIEKAGLMPLLTACRAGDLEGVRASMPAWSAADLLVLGAVAEALRSGDTGAVVYIHADGQRGTVHDGRHANVTWVESGTGTSELDLLRAVAVARIAGGARARIGVDWGQCGMELAQVALGFGASDLRGPITRKSGLPIFDEEKLKVKGQGMVDLRAIKKREIAALITHAGLVPTFLEDEEAAPRARESAHEVPHHV